MPTFTLTCLEYRGIDSGGALVGSAKIRFDNNGLILNDCLVFEGGTGQKWVSLPQKPWLEKDGSRKIGKNGKPAYLRMVEFANRATNDAWSQAALAAIADHVDFGRGGKAKAGPKPGAKPKGAPAAAAADADLDDDLPF